MGHSKTVSKAIGSVLIVAGVVLAGNPELVIDSPIPEDTFEAVERRVWWGALIGLGLMLWCHRQLRPWMPTVAAASAALLLGLLIARLIGIVLDGSVVRQWVYVGIEVVLLAASIAWFKRLSRGDAEPF